MLRKYEKPKIQRKDLLYPELSYKIVGALFEVYKQLGGGLKEKHYQKAVASELSKRGLKFKEQVNFPINYKGQNIGRLFLDFLIESIIVLELKKDKLFSRKDIEQVIDYLKIYNLKLGILANFSQSGVKFKRILNT